MTEETIEAAGWQDLRDFDLYPFADTSSGMYHTCDTLTSTDDTPTATSLLLW